MSESKLAKAAKMSLEEWSASIDEGLKKDRLKMLRERSGMSQSQFAKYFSIPKDTIQNWEQGRRKCPEYLLDLIEYKLTKEKLIKGYDDFKKRIDK